MAKPKCLEESPFTNAPQYCLLKHIPLYCISIAYYIMVEREGVGAKPMVACSNVTIDQQKRGTAHNHQSMFKGEVP
jgi:hypothetical protein